MPLQLVHFQTTQERQIGDFSIIGEQDGEEVRNLKTQRRVDIMSGTVSAEVTNC